MVFFPLKSVCPVWFAQRNTESCLWHSRSKSNWPKWALWNNMCVCLWLFVSDSVSPRELLLVACQTLVSMGFSREEYWSVLPFPSTGDLPNPGIEPMFPVFCTGWQVLYQLYHLGSHIAKKKMWDRIQILPSLNFML